MALPTWAEKILEGGLPALVDFGHTQAPEGTNDPTPEQTKPDNITGRDNANPPGNFLMNLSSTDILVYTALAVGIIATVHWMKE